MTTQTVYVVLVTTGGVEAVFTTIDAANAYIAAHDAPDTLYIRVARLDPDPGTAV